MTYAQHDNGGPKDLREAELADLTIGARLYLRDARRTPVDVSGHEAQTASFSVTVADFEDKGAEWGFALWDVSKFLVPEGEPRLTSNDVEHLGSRIEELDLDRRIACDPHRGRESRTRLSLLAVQIRVWLERNHPGLPRELAPMLRAGQPNKAWSAAAEAVMSHHGVAEMDGALMTQYASNPHAGEDLKAHRIVLAEMGLCPYDGAALRDPERMEGPWCRDLRETHILARLAFMRVAADWLQLINVPVYRGISSETGIQSPRNTGFVSTSFHRAVAETLYETGRGSHAAAMMRQALMPERLFATFIETPQLSARYAEAEAVLLFDPDNPLF